MEVTDRRNDNKNKRKETEETGGPDRGESYTRRSETTWALGAELPMCLSDRRRDAGDGRRLHFIPLRGSEQQQQDAAACILYLSHTRHFCCACSGEVSFISKRVLCESATGSAALKCPNANGAIRRGRMEIRNAI